MFEMLLVNTAIFGALVLAYVSVIFLIAQFRKDNSIMDIAYGPAFFLAALGSWWVVTPLSPLSLMILTAIGLWALRLFARILKKNWGRPEDPRYAAWRAAWLERGWQYYLIRSYLQIYMLQGLVIVGVAVPFIISTLAPVLPAWPWLAVGLGVFLFGLTYETIADRQLDRFIARKKAGIEGANLMKTGLFRYSRRPNYFGETLVWWGLAIVVFPLPYGWIALLSPLLITYIVTSVTGPMLEDIFLEKYPEEYRQYMRTTSYLIPWPPKS
mgnify:CR=1 FL=1